MKTVFCALCLLILTLVSCKPAPEVDELESRSFSVAITAAEFQNKTTSSTIDVIGLPLEGNELLEELNDDQ